MIEVEIKFLLTDDEVARLTEGATFLGEKILTDTYFEDEQFSLSRSDRWLRMRNGEFELKTPLSAQGFDRIADEYNELTTDTEIRAALNLSHERSLKDAIENAGYLPYVEIVATRRKYKNGEFNIDLDSATGPDGYTYRIAEIERMVSTDSERNAAIESIVSFGKTRGIIPKPNIRGKLLEYIYQRRAEHWNALVAAGQAIE